jgi:hypothetical protein
MVLELPQNSEPRLALDNDALLHQMLGFGEAAGLKHYQHSATVQSAAASRRSQLEMSHAD